MFGKKSLFNEVKVEKKWNGQKLILETGKFARQATGSVMATIGGTQVLATVVGAKKSVEGQDFFPLMVVYQEKFSAVGRIPGGFNKREGRPTENETLVSRLIDRPIRPLFPETFKNEVQIVCTVYSDDKENCADIVAMIAASACLAVSGLPFAGPIAGIRMGYKDGQYLYNPTKSEQADSELDLVVAGTQEGVLMVESEASELSEEVMLGAVKAGHESCQEVIKMIEGLAKKAGKEAWEVPAQSEHYAPVKKIFEKAIKKDLEQAFAIKEKLERYAAVDAAKEKAMEALGENEDQLKIAGSVFHDMESEIVRTMILKKGKRIDGRDTKTVRPIECEIDVLDRTHGSALFTRGETQSLMSLTLGTDKEGQLVDDIHGLRDQNFMLHYNFPPFSVGECGRMGGAGRREIGHGKLGWRSLHPMLPSLKDFNYTIKLTSDILESNGSSSMATVCAGTLALMAGGVPLKSPVAGIAMGLIKEGDEFAVLTDIMGDEDHLGDMDFKVAGTKDGITSLQMDIKITSITFEIMQIALDQAKDGRNHILGEMKKAIKEPRKELSKYAPQIVDLAIPADKVREVIGSGGSVIKQLQSDHGVVINIDDDNIAHISCDNAENIEACIAEIKSIFAEPEEGTTYEGKVVNVQKFGAFVNFFGKHDGLVHISEFGKKGERVEDINTVVTVGDVLKVKYEGKDRGKAKLTLVKKK